MSENVIELRFLRKSFLGQSPGNDYYGCLVDVLPDERFYYITNEVIKNCLACNI